MEGTFDGIREMLKYQDDSIIILNIAVIRYFVDLIVNQWVNVLYKYLQ